MKKDNDRIYDECEEIRKAHGGLLKPIDMINFASNPETELNKHFEWDDTKAAHSHRLQQARQIIRAVVVFLPESESEPTEAYVSLEDDRKVEDGGYRAIADVLNNDQQRALLLQQARKEMTLFQKKYSQLRELASVFSAMADVVESTSLGQDDTQVYAQVAN